MVVKILKGHKIPQKHFLIKREEGNYGRKCNKYWY